MITTILGRKLGMTQVWSDDDKLLPVTVIEAGPCVVTQVKTDKRDGYRAVQIGFGEASKVNKPMKGHFDKAKRRGQEVPCRSASRRWRRVQGRPDDHRGRVRAMPRPCM